MLKEIEKINLEIEPNNLGSKWSIVNLKINSVNYLKLNRWIKLKLSIFESQIICWTNLALRIIDTLHIIVKNIDVAKKQYLYALITPLCGLGGERLGRSVAFSSNYPESPGVPSSSNHIQWNGWSISSYCLNWVVWNGEVVGLKAVAISSC